VTVLLVSHDLSMVQTYAHDVLCLRSGSIQCQGPPNEILTPINMSLVFVRKSTCSRTALVLERWRNKEPQMTQKNAD